MVLGYASGRPAEKWRDPVIVAAANCALELSNDTSLCRAPAKVRAAVLTFEKLPSTGRPRPAVAASLRAVIIDAEYQSFGVKRRVAELYFEIPVVSRTMKMMILPRHHPQLDLSFRLLASILSVLTRQWSCKEWRSRRINILYRGPHMTRLRRTDISISAERGSTAPPSHPISHFARLTSLNINFNFRRKVRLHLPPHLLPTPLWTSFTSFQLVYTTICIGAPPNTPFVALATSASPSPLPVSVELLCVPLENTLP